MLVQITMLENVGYITELIANYCDRALGLTVFGASWCTVSYSAFRGMCSCTVVKELKTPFIVHHGNLLTMATVCHFGLLCIKDTHLCLDGIPAQGQTPKRGVYKGDKWTEKTVTSPCTWEDR